VYSRVRGLPFGPLLAIAVGLLIAGSAVGAAYVLTQGNPRSNPTPVAASPSCSAVNPTVADPTAPHGLFVLGPPTSPHNQYYADVQDYLVPNPVVCGADFWIPWNTVDAGPLVHPEYNFSNADSEAAPWISAGKEVNLIFEMTSSGSGQYVPSSILSEVPTIQCGDSPATPVEWNGTFETAYRAFIAAAVHHFEAEPGFGYIRFGLGVAGETTPVQNIDAPGCSNQLNATGFSLTVWRTYLTGMLAYEHSLAPTIQLMVALTPVYPNQGDNVTPAVAAAAASDGVGFGSEGLRANDSAVIEPDGEGCGGHGWCHQFWRFAGVVPLELQTVEASSPDGSGPTGSLVSLLPFGLSQHTQIFELYLEDWLTAFDPNYPAYAAYHSGYATTFLQTAAAVGAYSPE